MASKVIDAADRLLENLESATLFLRWVHTSADPGALRDEAGQHYLMLRELRAELPFGGLRFMEHQSDPQQGA